MNNAAYWAQRMKNMTDALEDKSYEYVKNLEEQFDRSIAEVEKDIAYWYQRFADNNEIDLAEAKKLLTKGELKELKWSVEEYIKYGEENAINEQWMSELENASAKAHISRLDGLKLQLTQQAEKLSHLTEKATESAGKSIYEDCYYRTAFELQQQIGVGTVMGGIDERRIEKVLSRPWTTDNQTFRDRCWTNKTALVNSVNRELTQMIMRGEKPDRTIKAIAKQFDVAKSKAGRLVMTESAFFAQQSQKDCFNELDVEKCKVVAALDKHTCSICGKLDGTIIKMSDYEVGSTAPPFHPWCRCTTAPYFENMEGIGERYARDVETGESFTVPKDMTYEQWKKLQDEKHGAGTVDIERKEAYNESVNQFTYCHSIEECEEYAKQFIGDGYSPTFKNQAMYKGISVEHANEINQALSEIYQRNEMPKLNGIKTISPTSAQGKKVFKDGADAVAAYNPAEKGIFLNKDILKNAENLSAYNQRSDEAWSLVMQNIDVLSGSQRELALIYQRAGRSLVGNGSVSDYITHEMGHHVQWQVLDVNTNNALGQKMKKYAPHISGYANASKSEYIAESFVAYTKGETELLDPTFTSFLDKKSILSVNAPNLRADFEFVKRGTSSFETVFLPKNEYAHVMSELAQNLTKEEQMKSIITRPIGNYSYTVENNGFGNYRVIGKKPIDRDDYDYIKNKKTTNR